MTNRKRNAALLFTACLLYVGVTNVANACTYVESQWGVLVTSGCFAHRAPVLQPVLSNLRAKKISVNPTNLLVGIDVIAKNYGPVGTDGVFPRAVLNSSKTGTPGEFDVIARVEVRTLSGQTVPIYDGYNWRNSIDLGRRAGSLAAGAERGYTLGQVTLPDRTQNYDVCVTAAVDPGTSANPGGEIWESSEVDNTRLSYERLFPTAGEPVYEDQVPTACPEG